MSEPVLLDSPAAYASTPHVIAWEEHRTHRDGCVQCRTRVLRCAEGDSRWEHYLTVNGVTR